MTAIPLPEALAVGNAAAGLRHAALALHAMGRADRDWMLSQLGPDERVALRALLDELMQLGVPQDGRLLEAARSGLSASPAPRHDGPAGNASALAEMDREALIARVAALTPERVVAVLREEPVVFASHLMRIHPWPWKAAAMSGLGHAHARRIGDAMLAIDNTSALGEQREASIMRALCRRAAGFAQDIDAVARVVPQSPLRAHGRASATARGLSRRLAVVRRLFSRS